MNDCRGHYLNYYKCMDDYKSPKGITLVTLVVTIIVLLILAGIGINFALGENGIINKAKLAVEKYKQAEEDEGKQLNNLYDQLTSTNNNSNNTNIEELSSLIEQIVDNKLLEKYPVGSIYISESETNPSEFLGGEWENYGQGRTLIGAGEGNDGNIAKTFANKETGGEYNHTLTIAEMPSHTHIQNPHTHPIRFDGREDLYIGLYAGDVNSPPGVHTNWTGGTRTYTAIAESVTATNQNTGESQPHNNIQPYITVHMWKRIS